MSPQCDTCAIKFCAVSPLLGKFEGKALSETGSFYKILSNQSSSACFEISRHKKSFFYCCTKNAKFLRQEGRNFKLYTLIILEIGYLRLFNFQLSQKSVSMYIWRNIRSCTCGISVHGTAVQVESFALRSLNTHIFCW